MAVAQYQDNGKSVHDALKQYKEGLGIFEQKNADDGAEV